MKKIFLISSIILIIGVFITSFSLYNSSNASWEKLVYEASTLPHFNPKKELKLYKKALKLAKKQYKENHPEIGIILFKIARSYYSMKDFSKAEPLYRKILETEYIETGVDSLELFELKLAKKWSTYTLAQICKVQSRRSEAEIYFNQALDLARKDLPDQSFLENILFDLARFYVEEKKYSAVERFLVEIQNMAELDYEKFKDNLPLMLTYEELLRLYEKIRNDEKIREIKTRLEKAKTGVEETCQVRKNKLFKIIEKPLIDDAKFIVVRAVCDIHRNDVTYETQTIKGDSLILEKRDILDLRDVVINEVKIEKSKFNNTPEIIIPLSSKGKIILQTWTKNNIGHRLAILINNQVVSTPIIQEEYNGPLFINIFDDESVLAEKVVEIIRTIEIQK